MRSYFPAEMQTIVCTTPGLLSYQTAEKPASQPGRAIIRLRRIGVCGTDLHAYEGTQPYFNYPRILGHELAGDIVEVDAESGFAVGEAVTIIPYYACGHCVACRAGKPNACVQLQTVGVHIDGGMVEFLSVPTNALVHGDGLTHDELALVEPLAIGAHGVRRAQVQPGEFVLVVGAGPIGLGVMAFAAIAGGTVIALDINENRLAFCQNALGIAHTVNARDSDVLEQIRQITNGDMPTVVIDATGSLGAINGAFTYLAHGGRYVLVGLQKGMIQVDHPEFHKREATLMSSRNATCADFHTVIQALKTGLVDPKTFITHRISFGQVVNQFAGWLDPANGVIKAMIEL